MRGGATTGGGRAKIKIYSMKTAQEKTIKKAKGGRRGVKGRGCKG